MLRINRHFVWSVFLILVVIINLMNVNVVLADEGTPPPPATEEPTQPPVEPTETPVTETPPPTETPVSTETPIVEEQPPVEEEAAPSELLADVPDTTDVVVLDEDGNPIPLASQEALNIILDTDPMWCPAGVLPGGVGCSLNFASIALLISNMVSSTGKYDENGIIYFTATAGGSLAFTPSTLTGGDFDTLNDFNLTLQGGWNGLNGASATFAGQTNFANNTITIGTSANPWVGNITLTNFTFSGVSSSNAVTIYTTSGNITLNNVDIAQQAGGNNTALLDSNSGNITVQNGSSFDGNSSGGNSNQNRGFSADTTTGTITITNTTFTDARGCLNLFIICVDLLTNYNGATLSAPTVTLTNVSATNNDLSGIQINNANVVNLTNVAASNNGTLIVGSGVNVNGTGSTVVNISGGTFNNNAAYGVSVFSGTHNVTSPMVSCTGNTLGCTNDAVAPVLTLPANITVQATGPAGTVVTYSATATDNVDGARTVTCAPASGSTFPITTTTVNCSASDTRGNTANGSFTVTVQDTTPPVLTLPANMTLEATGPTGAVATFSASATDVVDGARTVTCAPPSGSTFPIATTTVNCSASDTRGNTANGSFTVTVQDTTPPVLTLPANMTVEATGPAGAVATFSASATDVVDGARTVTCAPPSGSTFPIATTTVNCSASDTRGNTANGSFTVTVQDTTSPTLTLPANIVAEATSPAGAVVTYNPTANDIVDGTLTVTCVPPSGSTFPITLPVTSTTVNCSASDTRGNTANGSFTVTVQDTTPPVISPMANIGGIHTLNALGAYVTYTSPATSDIVDGAGVATCTPPSGSQFAPGITTVTCTATDSHGNTSSISFTVDVGYRPGLASNQSGFGGIIPITGGELIDLNCFTVANAFGVVVKFHHLCDQQATINEVNENTLPGALPSGYTFVQGLDIQVLEDGQILEALPNGAGVQADFPLPDSQGQFVVLYWNDGQWVEISQLMNDSDLEKMLSTDAQNEFYKMSSSNNATQKILTTELTGTFVLVQK